MNEAASRKGARRSSRVRHATGAAGIERAEVFLVDEAYSPHRHDSYAMGFTTAGVQTFDYRGETRHSLRGDAFVLHPDERHDGRPGTEGGFGYRILYIAPELIGRCLSRSELPFVTQPVCHHPGLGRAIAAALAGLEDEIDELHAVDIVASLATALEDASDDQRKSRVAVDSAAMARVGALLRASAREGVCAARIEREASFDRWSVYRQFRAVHGVSPYRYLVMRRLDLARRCILGGSGLADAAYASGFADQSHMTRQFRAAFGLTPGGWRSLVLPAGAGRAPA